MLSVQLSLKNKLVIIIGGGKQAWHKGQKFMKDGAYVHFYAKIFHPEIPASLCTICAYHKDLLANAFLVYACSNDLILNEQIVQDANNLGILSASVHQDKQATLHLMRENDFENLHVALTTKGASPSYGRIIMNDISTQYEEKYHSMLVKLQIIRSYVLSTCQDEKQRSAFLKKLAQEDECWISFLYESIQQRRANILCFHGNEEKATLQIIHTFMKKVTLPCYFAYLKEGDSVKSIDSIKLIMQMLQIPTTYFLIILEKGRIYQNMMNQLIGEHIVDCGLNDDDINQLIHDYHDQEILFVIHESKSRKLLTRLKQSLPAHMHVMELHEEVQDYHVDHLYVVPLLILKGKHFTQDILLEEGLYGALLKMNKQVVMEDRCLLEHELYQEILCKKIMQNK